MEVQALALGLKDHQLEVEEMLQGLQAEGNPLVAQQWHGVLAAVQDGASFAQPSCVSAVSACRELAWEKLHIGYYKDVVVAWRDAYALSSLLAASQMLLGAPVGGAGGQARASAAAAGADAATAGAGAPMGSLNVSSLSVAGAACSPAVSEVVRALDLGIMMGGPAFRGLLDDAMGHLELLLRQQQQQQQEVALCTEAASGGENGPRPRTAAASDGDDAHATKRPRLAEPGRDGEGSQQQGHRHALHASGAVEPGQQQQQQQQQPGEHEPPASSPAASPLIPAAGGTHFDSVRVPRGLLPEGSLGPRGSRPPVLHTPPLDEFLMKCMMADGGRGRPAIISGGMEAWPAMQRWQDLGYLRTVAGHRTVPVEVGKHYLEDGWGQQLMTLSDFIQHHLAGTAAPAAAAAAAVGTRCAAETGAGEGTAPAAAPGAPDRKAVGYLAQHELFNQIPALRRDILTPEYCALGEDGEVRSVNAWLGPSGTVTPLHTDPHHNLLAQVVGRKYVRLYSPEHDAAMYPFTEGLTTNTSQVDLDRFKADDPEVASKFPLFAAQPHFVDCILSPGQMLYIPPGWWHYVRSLSTSFSVSFWWS